MSAWSLASADRVFSVNLEVDDGGGLRGTATFDRIKFDVSGHWSEADPNVGRNASAFAFIGLSGGKDFFDPVPKKLAATGTMIGSRDRPEGIDINADLATGAGSGASHYSGALLPV